MTIYETIKTAISVKQAAEHYGLKVSRNGMACCPFHHDQHPSLKLNEDYFYCFGCGANARKYNLEHCNNITNSAGRRVWGFMGVEAIARPHINGFYEDSPCTYVPDDIPEEWRSVE